MCLTQKLNIFEQIVFYKNIFNFNLSTDALYALVLQVC